MPNNRSKTYQPTSSDNAPNRGKPKRRSFRQMDDTAPTWDSVPASIVHAFVALCTTQGASPTFGYTRNGRALTVAVWWKGDRDVQYLTTAQEVLEYLTFLADEWFDMTAEDKDYYALPAPDSF